MNIAELAVCVSYVRVFPNCVYSMANCNNDTISEGGDRGAQSMSEGLNHKGIFSAVYVPRVASGGGTRP